MRVVAGEFGGRKLMAPAGLNTRPTTDKVRQAVFNSLASRGVLEGATVADLYAGSGALGIEALSRGAASCVFVERAREALSALRANIATLGLQSRARVVESDVLAYAPGITGIDIALIDPPYTFTRWPELLRVLRADVVVAESGDEVPGPPGWDQIRVKRHGRTVITTLERHPDGLHSSQRLP